MKNNILSKVLQQCFANLFDLRNTYLPNFRMLQLKDLVDLVALRVSSYFHVVFD